ncbi:hypothetical protein C8258_03995 [Nocardia sp. MDA0666]|uniref:hypothetical protein n=1 Tax=Nocardia sp. MDA0666 TaxID=2135448 RepID=UPI000D128F02|nr:hypothetical protein [Nocardia sp. MDA0666]PSR70186.1 hypothetical protein C8258_03995 [Nocardia sp. MDA0666]
MTDTLTDIPTAPLRLARPVPVARATSARPVPVTRAASEWQEAKAVLVTRVAGPQQLVTVPRLVVPIGFGQLAFRVSSQAPEADDLVRDGRVLVQAGDWRGHPALGSHQRQGQAQVVTAGTLVSFVQAEIEAKYRWRIPLAKFGHRLARGNAPYGDVVVLVTVQEPPSRILPPMP